ncbi:MAG: 8-oxo-dGTP diphosphatase [Bacilli bacterium]|nr:8-oxo-dGTP diphosphatase [Bacilli bacterium]
MEETVLVYIERNNQYLLIYRNKKKNDMNQGKYIGIGGHIEEGETKEAALIREVKEETNLNIKSFKYRAKLTFVNDDYSEYMHLFTSDDFDGELTEDCNEGELVWVDKDKILDFPSWEGDRAFLKVMEETDVYFEMTLKYKDDKLISVERTL